MAWDSYKCHLSENTKSHLVNFNLKLAVIPGGCTKYIQAPDVSWNKIFKDKVREEYDSWMATDGNKEYTKGGNLKPASKSTVIGWVLNAWKKVPRDVIVKSFKICALTTDLTGLEDDKIHCLKDGQPCSGARETLVKFREDLSTNRREIINDETIDEENIEENEILIDEDSDCETGEDATDVSEVSIESELCKNIDVKEMDRNQLLIPNHLDEDILIIELSD